MGFFSNDKQETVEEKEPMDKRSAEDIFGFEDDYDKATLDEKYHQAVAESVNAGDTDRLADLDEAHATLGAQFLVDDTLITPEANKFKPEPTPSFDVFETAEGIGGIQDFWNAWCMPPSIKYLYSQAHYDACKKMHVPTDTNYPAPQRSGEPPLWFRAVYKLIGAPIWRIAFIVIAVLYWMNTFDGTMNSMSDGLGQLFDMLIFVAILAANTIFGIITNPIRIGLSKLANFILKQQLNHQELTALKDAIVAGQVIVPGSMTPSMPAPPEPDTIVKIGK